MVTQTFQEILFTPGPESLKEFPSPESLKRRIIISTKPPKEYLEAKEVKEKENDLQKGKESGDEAAWGKEFTHQKSMSGLDDKVCRCILCNMLIYLRYQVLILTCCLNMSWQHDLDEEDHNEEEDLDYGDTKLQQHEAPEYRRLITIHAGKPKGGLQECFKVEPDKVRRLSLSEQQLEKAVATYGKEIVRYWYKVFFFFFSLGDGVLEREFCCACGMFFF